MDTCKESMLRTAKLCAPRTRESQQYRDTLSAVASHLHGLSDANGFVNVKKV